MLTSRQAPLLLGVVALLAACAPNQVAPVPYELVGACSRPAHREIRLVRQSKAFETALRGIAGGGYWEWWQHRPWRCHEMRREVIGGFHDLSFVRTIAIDGIERRDMYFGVVRDSVVLLNPWVVDREGVRIDTTGWNYFIRARLDLQLGFTGELAAFTCVADGVAEGWLGAESCWAPAPINMSSDGDLYTISRRDRNYDPSSVYWVRPDGSLAEVPRFHPILDTPRL